MDESETQLGMGVKECPFCEHENSPNAKFCEGCNGALDSQAAEQTNRRVHKQESHVQELLEFIKEKHPRVIVDFYEKKEKVRELQELDGLEAKT